MPGKKALRLQDLEAEFEMQAPTVKNTAPLTADDVLDRLALSIKRKQEAHDDIETCKSILAQMRADGLVGDDLVHPAITLSWQVRKTWVYSPAVKQAQQLEQATGDATQRISEGWTARRPKPQELDA